MDVMPVESDNLDILTGFRGGGGKQNHLPDGCTGGP